MCKTQAKLNEKHIHVNKTNTLLHLTHIKLHSVQFKLIGKSINFKQNLYTYWKVTKTSVLIMETTVSRYASAGMMWALMQSSRSRRSFLACLAIWPFPRELASSCESLLGACNICKAVNQLLGIRFISLDPDPFQQFAGSRIQIQQKTYVSISVFQICISLHVDQGSQKCPY